MWRFKKECPNKTIIPANKDAICVFMKRITLERIYFSLLNKQYEIDVEEKIAKKVRRAIENTFALLG